ncbi:thiolase-like protein [Aspergillus aurantiobrunneus]
MSTARDVDPIALVGVACRFPGDATDPESFWNLLYRGDQAWSKIPSDRFNANAFYHPGSNNNGSFHTQGGHFLTENISFFDAPFFSITPSEARAMDPQLRLLLEVAYEGVENDLKGSNTTVYTALYNRNYEKMLLRDPDQIPFYTVTGNGEAMYSNRLSYFFDLRGPSFTLDTGCSGSLVALQNACQSIWTGQADQSIVGGSNLILDPASMIGPSFLQFYSAEGKGYIFDQRADRYGRGEGVACLVLKRLSAAVRDGDPVRTVIRSAAANQDGRTNGITAPSGEAQEALIRKTYAMAGLDLARTVYVEAHGSGTALGDGAERATLHAVFGNLGPQDSNPLFIGSVKTNIGHLESASGLAGIVKAVLMIKHGCIPPSLNFDKPPPVQSSRTARGKRGYRVPGFGGLGLEANLRQQLWLRWDECPCCPGCTGRIYRVKVS